MNAVDPVAIANRAQRTAARPDTSVWVTASAGSGKTKVLTDRVLALLLAGTPPQRILCLTFTKAAAAEMSNRVNARLAAWVTADDKALRDDIASLRDETDDALLGRARRLFAEVLDAPGGLQISTLHAFCQSLLRRFPLEAHVPPHFALMDERDAAEALDEALEDTIAEARDGGDAGLAEALNVLTARVHETNFTDLMAGLVNARGKLTRMLEAHGGVAGAVDAMGAALGLAPDETESAIIAAACEDSAFACDAVRQAALALAKGTKTDQERGAGIGTWLAAPAGRAAGFESYAELYLTKGEIRARLATKDVAAIPGILNALLAEAARIADVAARLRAARVAAGTAALMRIGAKVLERYHADKARRGLMDYDDLIQTARRLLERPGVAEWVLYKLDGGIDHILIDEAQDTNPDQWAIVKPIRAEFFAGRGRHAELSPTPRTVFAVGDRKQSIYSFQGASPEEFERIHIETREQVKASQGRWEDVPMNVSFRSTPAVLNAVNAVFLRGRAREGVALDADDIIHLAKREGDAGLVEVWPLVEPEATDAPVSWKPPVERKKGDSPQNRLAALIARRIRAMIDTNEILPSKGRPIRAGDIMVLVRRRTGFVEELVRQLKKLSVPVAGVDRMVLTQQMAVMDLVALGQFLLLPEDDLTLATVLKSPLVGLTEDELFTLAYNRGEKRLWEVLSVHAGSESRFGEAQKMLGDLLGKTDYLTPAELYGHVLVAGHGRRKLLARLGVDADDPIDEFMNLALAYQKTHPPTLQGFLHWLAAGDTEIKRDLEQSGGDAVRVITVHGAKGLQAPIVFLPDTAQVPSMREQLLWTEGNLLWAAKADELDPVTKCAREEAKAAQEREYHRLMYVAMTRAEDRLYVCGWKTKNAARLEDSWYGLISGGLEPLPQTQKVVDVFLEQSGSLPSGEVLRLTSEQKAAPERERALQIAAAVTPLPAWGWEDPAPERTPPKPLAPSRAATEPTVLSPLKDDGKVRYQRGIIIHRLLQSLPEIAPARRRTAAEAFVQRPGWGLSEEDRAVIVAETLAVLDNAAFAPLFAAGSHAEVPLTGLVGGFAVSGQVDRLAVTETDVWIIDYKTNRPPPQDRATVDPAYVFQMATYRAALQAIYPDRAIHCVLLWTHGGESGPYTMELDSAQMDAALTRAGLSVQSIN